MKIDIMTGAYWVARLGELHAARFDNPGAAWEGVTAIAGAMNRTASAWAALERAGHARAFDHLWREDERLFAMVAREPVAVLQAARVQAVDSWATHLTAVVQECTEVVKRDPVVHNLDMIDWLERQLGR